MCSVMDLSNLKDVRCINDFLQKNPKKTEKFALKFPFEQLAQLKDVNLKHTNLLGDVILKIIKHGTPREEIKYALNFYIRLLNHFFNMDKTDWKQLHKSLNVLSFCLEWMNKLHAKLSCKFLIKLLHKMATAKEATNDVIDDAGVILLQVMPWIDRNSLDDEVIQCAIEVFNVLTNKKIKLHLAHELLHYFERSTFYGSNDIYNYIAKCVESLESLNDLHDVTYIFNCLKTMFEHGDDVEDSVVHEVSVSLAKSNFPKSLAIHFHDEETLLQIKKLYVAQINSLFQDTPWTADVSLKQVIFNLSPTFSILYPSDEEFKYLEFYIEFVHKGVRHKDGAAIANEIEAKYENQVPYNNPALLKSIYLLYAAYRDPNTEQPDCYNLLLSLQHVKDIERYLTYHIALLAWVITFGSRSLRLKVVTLFIEHYHNEEHIVKILKASENQACLLDVIHLGANCTLQAKALVILKLATPPEKCFLFMVHLLVRPDISFDMVRVLMESQLAYGFGSESAKEATKLTAEFRNRIIFVIKRFVLLLCDEEESLADDLYANIVKYLYHVCSYVKNIRDAAREFVVTKLVERLVAWAQEQNGNLVLWAVNFLTLIVSAEVLHGPFDITKQVELRTLNLNCNERVVGKAVWLLKGAIRHSGDLDTVLIIRPPYLSLYRDLLGVMMSQHGKDVVVLLKHFMDMERECLASFANVVCITMHCRRRNLDANFITYLVHWCSLALIENDFVVPYKHIVTYVKYLNEIQYDVVEYATLRVMLYNMGYI